MKKSFLGLSLLLLMAVALTGCKNQLPTAKIDANPTSGLAPLTVSFDGSKSSDPDGKIVEYGWDFDDGTGTGATTSHTYRKGGTYNVTLTVKDDKGGTATAYATITVTENQKPVANIVATPIQGVAPLTVQFDGSKSVDPDGTVTSYKWDFGDNSTGSGQMVSHTYNTANTYTAHLTVTDNNNTDSVPAQATITVAPKPVVTTLKDKAENDQVLLERTYPNVIELGKEFTITVKATAKVALAGLLLNESPTDSPLPSGLQVVKGDIKGFGIHLKVGDTVTITYTLKATQSGPITINGKALGTPEAGGQDIKLSLPTTLQVKPAAASSEQ
ncbi:PKD domain-containing protein [Candidatus Acetothermia bacterium]|nr:PKD domain-containing protein [Candidatus Acetothermia bacterium]MBI3459901.1 PKD domain-containing protein [Candidatus Acetothermia bacterium]MBI3660682.1 PKD domain-containing protein [Candidatus Acetothermia bacterium]